MMGPNPNPATTPDWRYASIDIETLGLSDMCDMVEFGLVLDDLKSPIKDLPRYHSYVTLPKGRTLWMGEPYAMAMHSIILMRIAKHEDGYSYTPADLLDDSVGDFLKKSGVTGKLVVGGKNFQGFDMKFLSKVGFGSSFKMSHRELNPGSMFFDPKIDKEPPSLETCLKRAGIEKSVEHTAVADAIDVIRCIRYKYGIDNAL